MKNHIQEALERYEKFIIEVTDESRWIDGKPVFNGHKYVTIADAIKHFLVEELATMASKSAEESRKDTVEKTLQATRKMLAMEGVLSFSVEKGFEELYEELSQKESQ